MTNETYLRYPSEQKFYRLIALVMGSLGLNTHHWSWYEEPASKYYALQRKIVIICLPISVTSMGLYLGLHYKDHEFTILASILTVIPFVMNITCKVMTAQTACYKTAYSNFMDKIHLHSFYIQDFPEAKHNFVKNLLINTEKKTRHVCYTLMSLSLICCTCWVFLPIKHNFQNNHSIHNITTRLQLGAYFWQPFDFEYNFYGYCVSQVIVVYCGFVGTNVMGLYDTINLAFIFHLTGQINIIKYDLGAWQNKRFTDKEWEKNLKDTTISYNFITKYFKEIEAVFGLNVCSIYAQNLVEGGLLLYQFTSSGGDIEVVFTYGLMIPVFMGIMVIMSVVLENIRIQADDILNLVYALPWEDMSIRNQKLVQSIICQVQQRLEYKAAFNVKTGVQPAINIIKTTFSYYVMIKARKEM